MGRSEARAFLLLLRSLHSHSRQIQPQVPLKLLTLISPSLPLPSRLTQNPRSFSSHDSANPSFYPEDLGINGADDSSKISAFSFEETNEGRKGDAFGEIPDKLGDSRGGISTEHVETVVSILKANAEEAIGLSLDKLELSLSEEFVVKVIEASDDVGEKLIQFFKWALKNEESVKTSRVVELLVRSLKSLPGLRTKEAYMLWDLVKELGEETALLNTEILNGLISIFWKLRKGKAAFEVFNKFDESGCSPNAEIYYYTIQSLTKRSMSATAWSVCEKMINSGSLPDKEKIGEIMNFFCKGNKAKEAHLVYLTAKEKNLSPPRSSLDLLIRGLALNDETVSLALELLGNYPIKSFKPATKTFSAIVNGMCKVKKSEEVKKLLLRIVESGRTPRKAYFNIAINALSKGGELEDAVALLKIMEGRGSRPDVCTYTVVMGGYAEGGWMDEAYKISCEAKKRHAKLSPAAYHILTRGFCETGEFEKALDCLKEMKEHGVRPNADEYNKMMESLCLKSEDWRTSEKLMEEMKGFGLYLKGATP